jgi:hypothetical protein
MHSIYSPNAGHLSSSMLIKSAIYSLLQFRISLVFKEENNHYFASGYLGLNFSHG